MYCSFDCQENLESHIIHCQMFFIQVDVVYEDEDEGFVSAVNSLVASSKRPVILITNEPHYPHLARLMELHLVLKFSAPPSGRMSKWMDQGACPPFGIKFGICSRKTMNLNFLQLKINLFTVACIKCFSGRMH